MATGKSRLLFASTFDKHNATYIPHIITSEPDSIVHKHNMSNVPEEAIYQSADMSYIQLYIPLEISRDIVCQLGKLGLLMFRDLNTELSDFQRGYMKQLRKLDDTERLIKFLKDILEKETDSMLASRNHIASPTMVSINDLTNYTLDEINDFIDEIQLVNGKVKHLDESLNDLKAKLNNLIETRFVIMKCARFLEINPGFSAQLNRQNMDDGLDDFTNDFANELLSHNTDNLSIDSFTISEEDLDEADDANSNNNHHRHYNEENLSFLEQGLQHQHMVIGSINRNKIDILNKILFRLLRGNLFFQNIPIEQKLLENGELVEKDAFIIFTHGETLINKVVKIVNSLNGQNVALDKDELATLRDLNGQIDDLEKLLNSTLQTLQTELLVVNDQLQLWESVMKREKYIYATLNLFTQENQGLVAEAWVPSSDLNLLSNNVKEFVETLGSQSNVVITLIHTNRSPPTFHRTNKFTSAFQSIVDAYGVATYKEINASLATIVTFPFMFAIMFGDAGHGFILFLIALYLILNESKFDKMKRGEIFDMAYTGRYVLVLMGFFSIYTGLMYNDIFSKSMTLFKSGWEWPSSFKEGDLVEAKKTGVYPFGLDYAWHSTDNGLIFSNSYKMKLSILMGFVHMTYSLCFSYINYNNRNSNIDKIGNFYPSMLFMQSIFGYLSWAIVYKWSKDWIKDGKPAPGLLNMLINMFLAPGKIDDQLYTGQAFLQTLLLLIALMCVPWLLLYKPLMLRHLNKNKSIIKGYRNLNNNESGFIDNDTNQLSNIESETTGNMDEMIVVEDHNVNSAGSHSSNDGENKDEEFNFGDVMIHQVIHTIEFCLNCISHTASYLRLWALSLAHAQLSSVLWDMTIKNAFSSNNPGSFLSVFKVVALFAMWFVLTICILVCMEGTSAMLHALRLHWVEAMSKFFEGEGYAYEPFSFKPLED